MIENQSNELRLRGGSAILGYLNKFSATEKVIFAVFVVAAVVTTIIMAGSANSLFMEEVPAYGGTLHEGIVGLPHTINPVIAITDVDRDISAVVYAGLTKNNHGTIEPDLASGWTISPDGLTYTFELRTGLKFQNGMPLNAYDVIFTIDKIKDPALKSPRASDWVGVQATATSPTTIQFNLRQPYGSFLYNTTVGILPMKIWGNVTNDQFIFSEYNTKPIGAGPYKVANIDRDQGGIPTDYHLEAWSGYHSGRANIANIIFTFFPDQDHALNAMYGNYIDSLSSIPPRSGAELSSNRSEPYTVISSPLARTFGVFWNQNKNPILTDITVRKALSLAVDRSSIIKTVLNSYGSPISSILPIGHKNASNTPEHADLVTAQGILAKSGWTMGADGMFVKKATKKTATTTLSFTLYTADTPDLKQVAEILKSNWKSLGANVTVKVSEPSDLYQNVIRVRDYDALLFGEAVGKASDLYSFWHSSQRNSPGLNIAMYTNSRADKVLDAIKSATTTEVQNANFLNLSNLISEDLPAIFLYSPNLIYVVPKNLHGVDLYIGTGPSDRFSGIEDWYLETERVWKFFANN